MKNPPATLLRASRLVSYQGYFERLADFGGAGGCKVHRKKETAFYE